MATETLRQRLGLSDEEIDRLATEGMPIDDPLRAIGWLVERGRLIPPRIVSLKALAKFFGVTSQAVRVWRDSGLPAIGPDRFDLDAVVQWRLGRIRSSPAGDQLARAKAATAELALREKLGEVAPVEPLHRRMVRRVTEAKAILNQIPDMVAASLAEEGLSRDLAGRLRQRVEDVVHRSLRAVADLGRPPAQDEEGGSPEE